MWMRENHVHYVSMGVHAVADMVYTMHIFFPKVYLKFSSHKNEYATWHLTWCPWCGLALWIGANWHPERQENLQQNPGAYPTYYACIFPDSSVSSPSPQWSKWSISKSKANIDLIINQLRISLRGERGWRPSCIRRLSDRFYKQPALYVKTKKLCTFFYEIKKIAPCKNLKKLHSQMFIAFKLL